MKNTFGKRTYKCKCGLLEEQYVWETELKKHKFKCSQCKKSVGFEQLKTVEKMQIVSIRTDTKNR